MRKSLILCFILFPFLFSCLNLLGLEEKEEKGSIKVILEDSNDIDSYTVTILNDSEDLIAQRVSNPGTDVLFEDLEVGNYIVNILAYDINNDLIKTGSKIVEVKVDEVVNAEISLENVPVQVETGSVIITLPGSSYPVVSEPSSFTVSIYNDQDELIHTKSDTPGNKVEFVDLLPGSYLINIDGKDLEGNVFMNGSESINVIAGEANISNIQMNYLTGDINITITLPE